LRILITGATGLLGWPLAQRLAKTHEIWAVSRAGLSEHDTLHAIPHDFADRLDFRSFPRQIDVIIHLAQSNHYKDFPARALDIFDVNVRATLALLDYAKAAGARQFIFASSGGVYGTSSSALSEDHALADVSGLDFYLKTKYFGEQLIASFSNSFDTAILRLFFVYGPGQKRVMLIPRLFEQIRRGEPVMLMGADGAIINPIYVDDAVSLVAGTVGLPGHRLFNVAGREQLSIRRIAEIIAAEQGRPLQIRSTDDLPVRLVANTSRIDEAVGVIAMTDFAAGMRGLVAKDKAREPLWRE
jgi:UDP-glucose 4-epimerase